MMRATLAACLLVSSTASASGIPGIRFGYEHGSVVAANPTAIAYNPGALGFSGTQLFLDLSLAVRDFSWTHARGEGDLPEPAGFEGANYGTARAFSIGAGPQFAASVQLGDLVLGAGFYVPYGGSTLEFDRSEAFAASMFPGAADGVSRWHGYDASVMVLYGTAGAAWRWGALSIGAVGNVISSTYSLRRAQNSPIAGNDIAQEQRVYIEASSLNASFAAGVMLEALPDTLWFGASYQAQPGLGEMRFDGTYTLDPTVGSDGPTRTQDVVLHQALPDVVRMGARWKTSRAVELRLTAAYTRWSFGQTQCLGLKSLPCTVEPDGGAAPGSGVIKTLRRQWKDSLAVRAGFSVWIVPRFELFSGVGFENAAVPDATLDPLVADADNIGAALGGRLQIGNSWYLAASYNHQFYFDRDNTGASTLAAEHLETTSKTVDGGGHYKQWWGVVNVNLAKTF